MTGRNRQDERVPHVRIIRQNLFVAQCIDCFVQLHVAKIKGCASADATLRSPRGGPATPIRVNCSGAALPK